MRGAHLNDLDSKLQRKTQLPPGFSSLPPGYFSLGQDPTYYRNVRKHVGADAKAYFKALQDIVWDNRLLQRYEREPAMRVSLLREVTREAVTGQFARVARGGAILTRWQLSFPFGSGGDSPTLDFTSDPRTAVSNIHVLIGRNGVGKSRFLSSIANSFEGEEAATSSAQRKMRLATKRAVANVVHVSFSAFDESSIVDQDPSEGLIGIESVGLRRSGADSPLSSAAQLKSELLASLDLAFAPGKRERLKAALSTLQSDPIFSREDVVEAVSGARSASSARARLVGVASRLSSGHVAVLAALINIVARVEERSLVLLDEPESHLHPPLLSAYLRALADLLADQNGMAIIATHSPVVVQEVPRSNVWVVDRRGVSVAAARPSIETFGENVGTLTRLVFGLEVEHTGFHRRLEEMLDAAMGDPNEVIKALGGLGIDGRLAVAAMAQRVNHVASD